MSSSALMPVSGVAKPERVMHWTKVLAVEIERIGHIQDIFKAKFKKLTLLTF